LHIAVSREGEQPPVQGSLILLVPAAEQRMLGFTGGTLVRDQLEGAWRRLSLKL
jgi:alpha-glucosidase